VISKTALRQMRSELPRRLALVAAQIALLSFMSWVGHGIVVLLHLPLPGNVAGMLLTFAALSCDVLPVRYVEQGAGVLVRNLPLFFVPLAVGFVTQHELLAAHGIGILATLLGSAAVGFAVTGHAAQCVTRLQGKATIAIGSRHV
jgi:holin-like protein